MNSICNSLFRYPRFIREIICKERESCLGSSRSSCTQIFTTLRFRIDTNEVGMDRLGDWDIYDQVVRSGCKCRADKELYDILLQIGN